MLVALYTSRVILDSLGIVDFGIYNVVGGMVTMFTFFSSSLSNATQRFLNFKLGENDSEGTNHVFNLSLLIYFIISIVVLITAEIIGLWLLYHKLVIPPERVNAAFWVMQATIVSLFITLNGIVFNSMLIAKEDMKIYAYIGIIEACAKLAIAFAIAYTPFDKLKCIPYCCLPSPSASSCSMPSSATVNMQNANSSHIGTKHSLQKYSNSLDGMDLGLLYGP